MSSLTLVIVGISTMTAQISSVIWIIVSAHRLTELAENHLKKSIFLEINRKSFESLGIIGKVIRYGPIALMFLAPKFFERRGMIDANELSNMPINLRNKLLLPWIASIISSVFFFAFPYIGKNFT
jgi:hypothetical protein